MSGPEVHFFPGLPEGRNADCLRLTLQDTGRVRPALREAALDRMNRIIADPAGPGKPASSAHETGGLSFSFAGFSLEPDGSLFRGGTPIHLPPKELAALRLLLTRAGQI